MTMLAGQLMQPNPLTIGLLMPFLEIQQLFVTAHIGGAPVVDARGEVVGMVVASDLLRAVDQALDDDIDPGEAANGPDDIADALRVLTAADVMSPHVVWVDATMPVGEVASIMRRERVHRALVRDEGGQLAGILTAFDLLRVVAGELGR